MNDALDRQVAELEAKVAAKAAHFEKEKHKSKVGAHRQLGQTWLAATVLQQPQPSNGATTAKLASRSCIVLQSSLLVCCSAHAP
jgi:hypothetical protein